jgi:predicted acetyltransferase
MTIAIRTCRPDEFETFLVTCEAAFGMDVRDRDVERFRRIIPSDRTFAAFDDDVMVGTTGSFPFTLTVPGAEVPAGGVTMAGVLPSHRRRGVLSGLMRAHLVDARERGEPVAVLWASEATIYGRFGYGLATRQCEMSIERDRARLRDDAPPLGRVRLLDEAAATKVLPDVYERVRASTPGMFVRSHDWWVAHTLVDDAEDRQGGGPLFRAVWEDDGRAEAYALYRVHSGWDEGLPSGRLEVAEALATSARAEREMWRFLFGIDLVARITAHFVPVSHPLFFLVEEARRLRLAIKDGLWLRVVDVPSALAARTYGIDGELVLELADDLCPWNAGRWRVEVGGGRARVAPTERPADLALGIAALGSMYLGGVSAAELAAAGLVDELRPGAVARASHMFWSERAPWCPEVF